MSYWSPPPPRFDPILPVRPPLRPVIRFPERPVYLPNYGEKPQGPGVYDSRWKPLYAAEPFLPNP